MLAAGERYKGERLASARPFRCKAAAVMLRSWITREFPRQCAQCSSTFIEFNL